MGNHQQLKQSTNSKRQIPHRIITSALLAIIFGIALFVRIFIPHKSVFVGDSVRFLEVDPWYYMRLIDSLVHNFPHLIPFDPYLVYPDGGGNPAFPGFAYILATVIQAIGLGSPSPHTIDTVAAYFPAVLGALVTILVYFIGKKVFNRWVGILSAALIAILPGPFLHRTLLGFTDHHVIEVFFTTLSITFLILAIKQARQNQIRFANFRRGEWKTISTPFIYSMLAGIALGIYLVSWMGALLFVAIITFYLVLQFIIDHLRHNSTDYLCITGTLTLLSAEIMMLSLKLSTLASVYKAALLIAITVPIISGTISHIMAKRVKAGYYPLVLVGLGVISLSAIYFVNPTLFNSMLAQTTILKSASELGMVQEMRPLFSPEGHFSLGLAWEYFTTSFFISLISFGFIAYSFSKDGTPEKLLLLVWYCVILIMTLIANRFAYYLAINLALLTGYITWKALEFAGFKESYASTANIPEKGGMQKAKHKPQRLPLAKRSRMIVAVLIVFSLVFIPNIGPTITQAKDPGRIRDAWYDSLLWLKDNTPEPFNDPDYYYQLYEAPPPRKTYEPPASAYSVVSLREAGYWITRIAHRIPNHNPGGQSETVARFFAAETEASANQIIDTLGARFVVIDLPMVAGQFLSTATFAGKELSYFYDIYYQLASDGRLQPVILYHPEYYHSITVRLYNFDCKAVTPTNSTFVVSYQEQVDKSGKPYKKLISAERFLTYEDAKAYMANKGSNYRIVGINPFISPVPLEELKHYRLIHSSEQVIVTHEKETTPFLKIFEFTKALPKT